MGHTDNETTHVDGRKAGRQSAEIAEQTKEAIILAALRVFAREGFAAVGIREIAQEAGITHGLIRHHFGSKEGVWQAVIDFAVQRFEQALLSGILLPEDLNPVEAAKESIRNFLLVCVRYPQMIQLMLHEGIEGGSRFEYVLTRFEQFGDRMAPLLTRVQQHGYLQQFTNRTFFLYLLTAGAAPFGLRALSNQLLQANIFSEEQAQQHMDRLLSTLFWKQDH